MNEPNDTKQCACGHVADEHGGDPEHRGNTSCAVEGCDCIAFEVLPAEKCATCDHGWRVSSTGIPYRCSDCVATAYSHNQESET
jgi:hypothetical protein